MEPETLKRRLAARRTRAAEIALELVADCERAATRRKSRRNTPSQWNTAAWRRYLRAATTSPQFPR